MVVALRLSLEGFGTVNEILNSPSDRVLSMVEYVKFVKDYESEFYRLNSESSK